MNSQLWPIPAGTRESLGCQWRGIGGIFEIKLETILAEAEETLVAAAGLY